MPISASSSSRWPVASTFCSMARSTSRAIPTTRNIDKDKLLPDVQIVPAGVAELARLQLDEGAAYIRP